MNTFLILFLAPASVIDEWMKTPEAEREVQNKKMKEDWDAWMTAHADLIKETKAAGKTKRVTATGVVDARNDIMMYCIVEAASHEAAAEAFVGHPHFTIPEASIEVMSIRNI